MELVLQLLPGFLRMCGTASWDSSMADLMLISRSLSIAGSSVSIIGPDVGLTAALLTRMSMWLVLKVERVKEMRALRWAGLPT